MPGQEGILISLGGDRTPKMVIKWLVGSTYIRPTRTGEPPRAPWAGQSQAIVLVQVPDACIPCCSCVVPDPGVLGRDLETGRTGDGELVGDGRSDLTHTCNRDSWEPTPHWSPRSWRTLETGTAGTWRRRATARRLPGRRLWCPRHGTLVTWPLRPGHGPRQSRSVQLIQHQEPHGYGAYQILSSI